MEKLSIAQDLADILRLMADDLESGTLEAYWGKEGFCTHFKCAPSDAVRTFKSKQELISETYPAYEIKAVAMELEKHLASKNAGLKDRCECGENRN